MQKGDLTVAQREAMQPSFPSVWRTLRDALMKINHLNFAVPVAGRPDDLGAQTRVCERQFCYELYHQLRIGFGDATCVGAEIHKGRHPIIRWKRIPDLLIHGFGHMDRNFCVIEIKPASSRKSFKKDAETLKKFVSRWYYSGILLVFGEEGNQDPIEKARQEIAGLEELGIYVLWIREPRGQIYAIRPAGPRHKIGRDPYLLSWRPAQ